MRDFKLSCAGGETKTLEVPDNCVHVVGDENPLTIEFDTSCQSSKFERDTGAVLKPGNYGSVQLTSSTAQNVTVCLGAGESYYHTGTNIANLEVGFDTADIVTPLGDVTVTANSATQIFGANPNRREARITVPKTASSPIRIGGSGVSATKGGLIYPGVTEYVDTNAAIFAFNTDTSNDVDLSLMSVEKA